MTESVAVYDRDARVRYVNPTTERLFGMNRSELVGRILWEVFPAAVGNPFHRAFERVVATGAREQFDHYYSPWESWFENEVFVVGDSVCVVARDITNRKKAEAERERLFEQTVQSEALFRALGETVPDLLWMSTVDGEPLYQNPASRAYTNVTQEDLLRGAWRSIHPPEELAEIEQRWSLARAEGKPFTFEGRLRRHDGALRWFIGKTVPVEDEHGRVVRWVGILTDVHDRRLAVGRLRESEERLARERERLALALRAGQLGIYEWAPGDPMVWWSPEMFPVFGVDPATFTPTVESVTALIHPDDRDDVVRKNAECLERREIFLHEYRVVRPDGTVRWVHSRSRVVVDPEGHERVVGVASDITDRKSSEQSLKESKEALEQADRRKDEFLATLAHELRNPLAPIRTGVTLMSAGAASPKILAMMDRQLGHMVRLIDDLLDVSRVSRGKIALKKERVALDTIVESALETSRAIIEARRHELVVQLPKGPIELDVDAVRIAQVLSNLLHNAAKYTPDSGRIELAAEVQEGLVVVRVTDTGVGIAPDAMPRAFDMFTQVGHHDDRTAGGLGIGLALARSLAELHGGTLRGTSEGPGRGSSFVLELPLASSPAPKLEAAPDAPHPVAVSRRVLVVDDNEDAAETLAMLLERGGHATRVAFDGHAALELAATFEPDVVVLDIGLPGMSGYEVAAELRRRPPHARTLLVALTGWGADADRQRSREAGFDVHLTKPVESSVIEALLRR